MMKRVLWSVAAAWIGLAGPPAIAAAQQPTTVTGRVTSAAGEPLAGVLVSIAELNLGGYTDDAGSYTLNAPATATGRTVMLSARRIGYLPDSAPIALTGATVQHNVSLTVAPTRLEGVVVTALGIERERSQLGTAQQQLSSEELNVTKSMNLVQQIQGKVSGVQITGAGTPGGSTNIIMRGGSSIRGDNQPLFIVDGIPVSNSNRGGGLVNGYDYGNAISDLNPEDVESMTILKGPNSAALYGSRAANGVIVITTKKGQATSGRMRTQFSTSYTVDKPSLLPDFQNLYGQGAGGNFAWPNPAGATAAERTGYCSGCDQSWGPRLDGRPINQFTGVAQPWVAHPDNVESFFESGSTLSSTIAVSGGTERASARLSIGRDDIEGYVPNNSFKKTSALLNANLAVTDRLNTTATLQYIRNGGRNRPGTGYSNSVLQQFFWFGRQVDLNALRNYQVGGSQNHGPAAREFNWNYNYHNNPFWIQFENPLKDTRDRSILSASANYQLADWLGVMLRSGSDIYRFDAAQQYSPGYLNSSFVNQAYQGGFVLIDEHRNENNTELLFTANRELNPRLSFNGLLGGAIRREHSTTKSQQTTGISVPGIYNVSNAAVAPTLGQFISRRQVNGAFASASMTWDEWLTLEGTGRTDWSSTLPEGKNRYFYPSVNASAILTNAFPAFRTDALSFVKVRASVAEVGRDATPYQLETVYTGLSQRLQGQAQFTLGDSRANSELKPEITRSNEIGLELGFFDGRASFDGTYYLTETRNQIFDITVSAASGYASQAINAGQISNRGFEALLTVVPIDASNGFRWESTINYARNRNEVDELYPGIETILLGQGIFGDSRLEARVDRPYGAIMARRFATDPATGKVLTEGGFPVHGDEMEYLGTIQPDWTGGWGNELSFRNFRLGMLFDVRKGGKIVSYTNMVGNYSGVLKSSLAGREVDWDDPGVTFDGIDIDTGQPNTTTVSAEEFYQSFFGVIEPYVYDASYVKLRELRLGYTLPTTWASRLLSEQIDVALTGRNLWLSTDVPNVDPEFAYSSGNFQGFEYAIPANPRSIGVSLRITP